MNKKRQREKQNRAAKSHALYQGRTEYDR